MTKQQGTTVNSSLNEDYHGYVRSISYYFSGSCNLSCTYCFNPQLKDHNKEVNKKIQNRLASGAFIDDILEVMDPRQLESFSLWGGEPSLNLPQLIEHLPRLYDSFPLLKDLSLSTNISTPVLQSYTVNLLEALIDLAYKYKEEGNDRPIILTLQFSMDGPPEINDPNRGQGIGKTLRELIKETVIYYNKKLLNDEVPDNFSLQAGGKPTIDETNIEWLCEPANMQRWYRFYDEIYQEIWDEIKDLSKEKNKKDWYLAPLHPFTYVTPGKFTSTDGKNLAQVLKNLYGDGDTPSVLKEMDPPLKFINVDDTAEQFYGLVEEQLWHFFRWANNGTGDRNNGFEFQTHHGCSAGLSMYGFDHEQKMHLCQETFFYDDTTMKAVEDKQLKSVFNEKVGWDYDNYNTFVKGKMTADVKDNYQANRLKYFLQLPQTDWSIRVGFFEGMVHEAWLSGQITPDFYEDPLHRFILAYFLATGFILCTGNNIFDTGHTWLETPSQLRFVGNGALRICLDKFKKKYPFVLDHIRFHKDSIV